MSITITISILERRTAPARGERELATLLGAILLPIAEDFVPGLGVAVAAANLLRVCLRTDISTAPGHQHTDQNQATPAPTVHAVAATAWR